MNLEEENEEIEKKSARIASLYHLEMGQSFKEITQEVLDHPETKEKAKERIREYNRRIYLFTYPSDGLQIKGYVSFTPLSEGQPLLLLLRGGNRQFGLLNPGADLGTYQNYMTLATTYRGGVSEGTDEFGGADVNDVKNLVEFIPELEKHLGMTFSPSQMVMLGCSRGGMEMFLALSRFPKLQDQVSKVISLSGILDIRSQVRERPDMKEMFTDDFGFTGTEEWLNRRNPILTIPFIKTSLPLLIIQGTNDQRVSLSEGHLMVEKLKKNGCSVAYWEIEGGDHCLIGKEDRMDLIAQWIETLPCIGINYT